MCDTCGGNITPGNEHLAREKNARGVDAVTVLKKIRVEKNLPGVNAHQAQHNRAHFDEHRVLAINPMSSPGAGKTLLFEANIEELKNESRIAAANTISRPGTTPRVEEQRIFSCRHTEMVAMDTLLKKTFALLLLSGASLTTLVMPAAKAWAAEPVAPAPSDQGMQRMMPPQQGGMPGMGPGSMTGRPGMMGGAMGPGMGSMGTMGGMGGGMMCPMCAGAGMVGGSMDTLGLLNLTDEQRNKIEELQDDLRKKNWDTYGKILDEQVKLRKLSQADPLDPKKIGAAYGSIGKLQQQLAEMQAEHWNGMMAVLTQEQKERLKRWQVGEPGMGMMSPSGMMAR